MRCERQYNLISFLVAQPVNEALPVTEAPTGTLTRPMFHEVHRKTRDLMVD
ncbi:MAG: hypothetical protein V3U32_07790 [Anaerolineales bacterium]